MYRPLGFLTHVIVVTCCMTSSWQLCFSQDPVPLTGLRTVALSTNTVPGQNFKYGGFAKWTLNERGQVAFLSVPTNDASRIMAVEREDYAQDIQRMRDLRAIGSNAALVEMSLPQLTDTGVAYFLARSGTTPTNARGSLWSWGYNDNQPVQLAGPGIPVYDEQGNPVEAEVFNGIGMFAANNQGDVAFQGWTPERYGMWALSPGQTAKLLATKGQPAPGLPPSVIIENTSSLYDMQPEISESGSFVFSTRIKGPGIDTGTNGALFHYDGNQLTNLAYTGGPAAGFDANSIYKFVSNRVEINGKGDVLLLGQVSPNPFPQGNGGAAIIHSPATGASRAVITTGQLVPMMGGEMAPLESIAPIGEMVINDLGEIAFLGRANAKVGAWMVDAQSQVHLIAQDEMLLPGTTNRFLRLEPLTKLSLNNRGEVAFRSHYFGEGVQLDNTSVILRSQREEPLEVVARSGDFVQLGPADVREVAVVNFPAYEGGAAELPKGMNDRGDMVFHVTFKDLTSGLFVHSSRIPGDFDENGLVDVRDLDAMDGVIQANSHELNFDLNLDLFVNLADRNRWVTDIKKVWYGDANLDGVFDSTDFIQVFQTGEYQDEIARNSGWADGDWNGDGDFDSGDFVLAFQDGGFEKGARSSVVAVPEPQVFGWLITALFLGYTHRSRRRFGNCVLKV